MHQRLDPATFHNMSHKLVLALLFVFSSPLLGFNIPLLTRAKTEVLFSPKGGIEQRIVHDLSQAKKSCIVEAYTLTNVPIITALVEAQKRGVVVEILLDADYGTNKTGTKALAALNNCIRVDAVEDSHGGISHVKIILIDDVEGIAGSYNFTGQAERANHECIFILHDKTIVSKMVDDYTIHKGHSTALPIPVVTPPQTHKIRKAKAK